MIELKNLSGIKLLNSINKYGYNIKNIIFTECEFKDLVLAKYNFSDCVFIMTDFANCIFWNEFKHCEFNRTRFISTNKYSELFKVEFNNCSINYSIFYKLKLWISFNYTLILNSLMEGCDLSNADKMILRNGNIVFNNCYELMPLSEDIVHISYKTNTKSFFNNKIQVKFKKITKSKNELLNEKRWLNEIETEIDGKEIKDKVEKIIKEKYL
jgi:hypothetical protein